MLRLKTDRSEWPVVNGEPVKPYELPDRPYQNAEELHRIAVDAERERWAAQTMLPRALDAIVASIRKRKGRGFEVTLLRRFTFEFHRIPTSGGEKFKLELYRPRRWDFIIEFWRSL